MTYFLVTETKSITAIFFVLRQLPIKTSFVKIGRKEMKEMQTVSEWLTCWCWILDGVGSNLHQLELL